LRGPGGAVAEIDLAADDPLPEALVYASLAYVLVRDGGRPVARLVLEGEVPRDRATVFAQAREVATAPPTPRTGGVVVEPGAVSVIVATRDRPNDLDRCLEALSRLSPGPGEIVVADSASVAPGLVAMTARKYAARYVRCRRPGLSIARNTGARAARGAILAFLDDDCRAEAGWLRALCEGFGTDGADVVTGQLLPSELDTEAQRLFLRYSHMDRRGFEPHRFTREHRESKHWPIDAWRMGSGGNLAVRADAYWQLGGFRADLGLGTPSLGGEDLYFLWSVVQDGGAVVYRPDALAWHRHHRDRASLERVMFGYGCGHAAFLAAARAQGFAGSRAALYRASFWYDRLKRLARSLAGRWPVPARIVLREMAGALSGRRRFRRAHREVA
jgi:glycosyltransferase involved in cell wall biosynthesis